MIFMDSSSLRKCIHLLDFTAFDDADNIERWRSLYSLKTSPRVIFLLIPLYAWELRLKMISLSSFTPLFERCILKVFSQLFS